MNVFDVFIVQPIFNLLTALYSIIPGGDFGLAVIIFTILVRIAMWPLVKKQIEQVKAMRKVQPEMAKIKRKAKGNRQLEGMMMLELYKKHNVNPFRSIFVLLIQLPIFIGLYSVIQIFTQQTERLAEYAYGFIEAIPVVANAIANPETISLNFLGLVDLTQQAIGPDGLNIFLLLIIIGSGILQYISGKQTLPQNSEEAKGIRRIMAEAADGKDPDQAEMNAAVMRKMIFVMPFMMVFIMINLPGILALYFAISTVVAVIQQHILLRQAPDDKTPEASDDKKTTKKSPATESSKKIEKEAVSAEVVGVAPVAKAATTTKTVKSHKKTKREKSKRRSKVSADNPNVIRVQAKATKKKGAK